MKKSILILTILFLASSAYAISWSQLKSWGNKTLEPDVKYSIETEGYNVRVYEFNTISETGSTCNMNLTNKKMGMFCFNKSKEAIRKE